jgi:hypothetical protein
MADGADGFGHPKPRRQRAIAQRRARGYPGQCVPDLLLERRAGDAPFDRSEAVEIALEIAGQCAAQLARRPRVLQIHRAIMQAQQLLHARLIILPVQRAEQAVRVGDQQRRPDGRLQAVEVEALWHRHSLKNIEKYRQARPALFTHGVLASTRIPLPLGDRNMIFILWLA